MVWMFVSPQNSYVEILFFFLKIFLMWTIFKVFIESVTILLLFYVLFFWPRDMWDPSSPTRDWTCTPCIGKRSLNHWTAREVPICWNPNAQCDGISRWAFGRWLGHEGRSLMNKMNALIKDTSESSLAPFCHVRIQWEVCDPEQSLTSPCWYPDLGLPDSIAVRNKFLFFISYPVCSILL